MGILNVTPDSFSDGGRDRSPEAAVRRAEALVADGADVLDVGGESTRPGASPVSREEELRRVIPVIRALAGRLPRLAGSLGRGLPVPVSVDTAKADVAREAIEAGAALVNDVTALRGDPAMARVVAEAGVGVILMHMQGTPRTMQRRPRYHDVIAEIRTFLAEALNRAERAGIPREHVWLDPGLGFGKTVAQNLRILHDLAELASLGRPLVIGPSRKSFIGGILHADVGDRVVGTLACVAAAASSGVALVRVHDVKPAVQFLDMWRAIETVKAVQGTKFKEKRSRSLSLVP